YDSGSRHTPCGEETVWRRPAGLAIRLEPTRWQPRSLRGRLLPPPHPTRGQLADLAELALVLCSQTFQWASRSPARGDHSTIKRSGLCLYTLADDMPAWCSIACISGTEKAACTDSNPSTCTTRLRVNKCTPSQHSPYPSRL